jgi:hypothetical protein
MSDTEEKPEVKVPGKENIVKMSAVFGKIEQFDTLNGDLENYFERFEQFLLVNKINETLKVSMFITHCGSETYDILKNLSMPDSPVNKTYAQIKEILGAYFSPRRIIVVERFKFYKREQKVNETIASYVMELKKMAQHCKFGTFLSEALRDRMVCGINDEMIQRKLLAESDLTYDSALRLALNNEAAQSQSTIMHQNVNSAINYVRPSFKPPSRRHRVHRIKGIRVNAHVVVDSMTHKIVRQEAGHVSSVKQLAIRQPCVRVRKLILLNMWKR